MSLRIRTGRLASWVTGCGGGAGREGLCWAGTRRAGRAGAESARKLSLLDTPPGALLRGPVGNSHARHAVIGEGEQ